jgi:hypothetical protein
MAGGYALVPGDGGQPAFSGPSSAISTALEQVQNGVPLDAVDFQTVIGITEELRASRASTVIVGNMPHGDEIVTLFTEIFHSPPQYLGGVAVWDRVQIRLP